MKMKKSMQTKLICSSLFVFALSLSAVSYSYFFKQTNQKLVDSKTVLPLNKIFDKIGNHLIPTARATGGGAPTVMSQVRDGLFLIIGYPDTATYTELTGGEGPPQNGLLGIVADIFSGIDAVLAANGYSCSTIPASGSLTATIEDETTTITFATPTKTPPTGFTGAGATLAKRVLASNDMGTFALEFNCSGSIGWMEAQTAGDSVPGSTRKMNMWLDGDNNHVEFFMAVDVGNTKYDGQVIILDFNDDTKEFDLWLSSAYTRGTTETFPDSWYPTGYRASIKGNSETGQASIFYAYEQSGTAGQNLSSITDTDVGVSTGVSFDFQEITPSLSVGTIVSGCVDFDAPDTNPTDTSFCTGLTPEVMPAWSIDPSKAGSLANAATLTDSLTF